MRKDYGRKETLYVHVTWLPYLAASKELKTKPTQHSVRELREVGIHPDVIILRSDHPVDEDVRAKTALFCDVDKEAVIPLVTANLIYEVPLSIESTGLGDWLVRQLNLQTTQDASQGLAKWRRFVEDGLRSKPVIKIGIVGKYVELEDAYLSVKEALTHASFAAGYDPALFGSTPKIWKKVVTLIVCKGLTELLCQVGLDIVALRGKLSRHGLLELSKCHILVFVLACK